MRQWVEIDGLAYVVASDGKTHRWKEYCTNCRRRTQISVEEGFCGPGRVRATVSGTSAMALSADGVILDNGVHYARCSVCGRRDPYPLEFR